MKRTILTTMTTALAAVTFVGIIPGAAFAQWRDRDHGPRPKSPQGPPLKPGPRGGDRDRRGDWRADQNDRNRRDNGGIWDRIRNGDLRTNLDDRYDRDDRYERDNRDNRDRWDWDNRDNRNDGWYQNSQDDKKRQKTKNDWRNLATAAGGIAVIGALKKDPRIVFAGVLGGLYSLNRYEQDRKSQSQADRARASVFSQPYLYRDGNRYERREIVQNGERYYRFERQ